jgi:hypothetical protein
LTGVIREGVCNGTKYIEETVTRIGKHQVKEECLLLGCYDMWLLYEP